MSRRPSSRAPLRRFVPSPPPGAGVAWRDRVLPPLPVHLPGAPRALPPGASRPMGRLGGIRGVGTPPEIRRRVPGAVRAAPGATQAADLIRLALKKAQGKLLDSQQKLQSSVAVLRAKLASRR